MSVGAILAFLFFVYLSLFEVSALAQQKPNMSHMKILVTGGNAGIGLALCKKLVKDYGCHVYLGARDPTRGKEAIQAVKDHVGGSSNDDDNVPVELVILDVSSDESVEQAAKSLKGKGVELNAIVNNAGRGGGGLHKAGPEEILNVNFLGTKRVVDNFLPLLANKNDRKRKNDSETCTDDVIPQPRIVSVGSGGGASYVSSLPIERQKLFCSPDPTWEQVEELYKQGLEESLQGLGYPYGLSKALVHLYTIWLAKELKPDVLCFALSPGWVKTAMTEGQGASLTPEQGTKSILHCLFDATPEQSGWYFGSDCQRSPLNFMRNPGQPVFDGVYSWETSEELQST